MEPKKYEHRRIERKIPLFFLLGLNIALLLSIAAFEWKTTDVGIIQFDTSAKGQEWDSSVVLPPPPPPPMPEPPKQVVIVETKIDPIDPPKVIVDSESPTAVPVADYIPPTIDYLPEEAPFFIVEEMPSYPGGWQAFYTFIGKNIKYPKAAQRLGIEGKVYLEFTIERDGSISDIVVKKGMEGGLSEEALRVIKLVPEKFNPGKQRGKPVRVRRSIPINFQLSH